MKTMFFAAVLAVALIPICAAAQPAAAPAPAEKAAAQPGQVTEQQRQQWDQQLNEFKDRLSQANVSEERKMQATYVLGAVVMPFDPPHVLAVKDDLKLTDEQIQKLKDLEKQGQEKTRQILNEEQRALVSRVQPALVLNAARQAAPLIMMPRPTSAMPPAQPPAGTPPTTPPPASTPPATTQRVE